MEAPQVQVDTSVGSFNVELYYRQAPQTVKNFLELSKRGYFDGTKVRELYLLLVDWDLIKDINGHCFSLHAQLPCTEIRRVSVMIS